HEHQAPGDDVERPAGCCVVDVTDGESNIGDVALVGAPGGPRNGVRRSVDTDDLTFGADHLRRDEADITRPRTQVEHCHAWFDPGQLKDGAGGRTEHAPLQTEAFELGLVVVELVADLRGRRHVITSELAEASVSPGHGGKAASQAPWEQISNLSSL